jgi:nitrate reductase (NAD(P)H)
VTESGAIGVRFQHPAPVELGKQGNVGWREQEKLAREGAEAAAAPPPPPAAATAGEQPASRCLATAAALADCMASLH